MRKNNMRTPEEKEKIIKDLLSGKTSWSETYKKYNLSESVLSHWKYAYLEKGIDGLKSKTGKHSCKSILFILINLCYTFYSRRLI